MKRNLLLAFFFIAAVAGKAQCVTGNCTDGNGTYKWDNGDRYAGDWQGGKRTGYGRYDWADGSYYVGYFSNDLLEGEGSYYGADGTKMIGTFKDNQYQGADATTTNYDDEDTDLDSILDDWEKADAENEKVKAQAIKDAVKLDFVAAVQKAVDDFPNHFSHLKGPQEKGALSFGDTWYSTLMAQGSLYATVSEQLLGGGATWTNTLYEAVAFDDAKAKYDFYVQKMQKGSIGCCTLVYDTSDYKGDSYESYMTYWIPFLVRDGYDEDTYQDMVIEIELSKKIAEEGWEVYVMVTTNSD